jgi:AcrR family transcriptional regulator
MPKLKNSRTAIETAIQRIQAGTPRRINQARRLSIVAVAEEAGLSPSTIHNRYPDLAEAIRQKMGVSVQDKLHTARKKLNTNIEKAASLRERLAVSEEALSKSRSIVLRQALEIEGLQRRITALEIELKAKTNLTVIAKKT